MDKKYLFHQFFSLIGDKSIVLFPYLTAKTKNKIQDFIKTPIQPNNSLELEQLLNYVVKEIEANSMSNIDTHTTDTPFNEVPESNQVNEPLNSSEDTTISEDKPSELIDAKIIKLSKQSPQIIAFYLSNLDENDANYYKENLDEKLLKQVNKVFVEPMSTDQHVFDIIHNDIEST